jgi:hypothetical protein
MIEALARGFPIVDGQHWKADGLTFVGENYVRKAA